jgi:hypothetical protein
MAPDALSITCADPGDAARLRQALKAASRGLGWTLNLPVVVIDPADEPEVAEAGVDGTRLWIRPSTLQVLARPDVLATFLSEEVAHAYLGSLGVPHGPPAAVIFQEAFAKWFMVRRARELLPHLVKPGLVEQLPPYAAGDHRRQAHVLGSLAGFVQANVPGASERFAEELEGLPDGHPFSIFAKWLGLARHPSAPRKRAEGIALAYRNAEERAEKLKGGIEPKDDGNVDQ